MPKLPAVKPSPHNVELERLRRAIPVAGYLQLIHNAVTTGQMPILDINGNPTGEFQPLEAKDRLGALHKLIDKAMPDRQEAPMLPEDASSSKTIDVRNMSMEELNALANSTPASLIESGSSESSDSGDEETSSDQGTATSEDDKLH